MKIIPLQSGSAGNCIYIESGEVRLLFDAGVSGSQVQERLAKHGVDAFKVNAVFITHEHSDHIQCAGILSRKFGLPLYITVPTYRRAASRIGTPGVGQIHHFKAGASVKIGHVTIESLSTPHDAIDGVVFVIDDGSVRLAICTDIGHVFAEMHALVGSVDGLFLESNFDQEMLKNGRYPASLKQRIAGPGGHISNIESAELIAKSAGSRLQWLYAGHLSEDNNRPAKVLDTHRQVLGEQLEIQIASRYCVSPPMELASLARIRKIGQDVKTYSQPELFPRL
jgi:phosphoribosyl 1,2-cyclic phosphodiesterase